MGESQTNRKEPKLSSSSAPSKDRGLTGSMLSDVAGVILFP